MNYISHHGILGQKWGKRNGPPYPLGGGDYTEAEKRQYIQKGGMEIAYTIKSTLMKFLNLIKQL